MQGRLHDGWIWDPLRKRRRSCICCCWRSCTRRAFEENGSKTCKGRRSHRSGGGGFLDRAAAPSIGRGAPGGDNRRLPRFGGSEGRHSNVERSGGDSRGIDGG